MKTLNRKLVCLAALTFASASAVAQGMPHHLSRDVTSSVTIYGSTSASANGRDVLAYGRTSVEGQHVGRNGATNYSGVVGAEGSGNYHTNAQTSLMFNETRGTTDGGYQHWGSHDRTSNVNNMSNISSNAYAADPKTLAWGDMRMNGTLTGPDGSSAKFNQNHGYDAVSTYRASGQSNGYFGQEFRVRVGPTFGW